ncbi:hypothetical protein BASA81_016565 [Batrachochytrium salamandrivorans]|nr:hypothetical protein BASA81_016565 [Batrachochytrium salamandrivorans]
MEQISATEDEEFATWYREFDEAQKKIKLRVGESVGLHKLDAVCSRHWPPTTVAIRCPSDYNAAKIQEYVDSLMFPDPKSSTGYSAWNKTGKYRIEAKLIMQDSGLHGLTGGIPIKTNVKVYTIIATYSLTTAAVRKFYPLNNAYTGNLMQYVDPTNSTALDEIKKKAVWSCRPLGCDYTFKMTYTDGSVIYQLHQNGFRKWFKDDLEDGTDDPLNKESFRIFSMSFPGSKKAKKVEFLSTPMVLTNGFPTSPVVLMSYVYP